MTVYVVRVRNKKTLNEAVSTEGYATLEQAQAFCQGRVGARRVTPWDFESATHHYWITDITVKEVKSNDY